MCLINQRSAPVLRALETAASVDADAKEVWDRFQQQRRSACTSSRRTQPQDRPLRHDESTITDTLWMLTPDAYLRLVQDAAGQSNASRNGSPTSSNASFWTEPTPLQWNRLPRPCG